MYQDTSQHCNLVNTILITDLKFYLNVSNLSVIFLLKYLKYYFFFSNDDYTTTFYGILKMLNLKIRLLLFRISTMQNTVIIIFCINHYLLIFFFCVLVLYV